MSFVKIFGMILMVVVTYILLYNERKVRYENNKKLKVMRVILMKNIKYYYLKEIYNLDIDFDLIFPIIP